MPKALTKNERSEVISALVINCNCKDKKKQAAIFNEFDDDTLIGLLAPVVNAMDSENQEEARDEDQEEDETNNEFDLDLNDDGVETTGDPDGEEDLDDAGGATRSGYDSLKSGGTGGGDRPGDGNKVPKKAGINNTRGGKSTKEATVPRRLTRNEFMAIAPLDIVETLNEHEAQKKAQKKQLIKMITSNEGNDFTKEYLATKDLPELRALAKLATHGRQAAFNQQREAVPMFIGAAGAVHNSQEESVENEDPDELYVPETLNYAEIANLDAKKMRKRTG